MNNTMNQTMEDILAKYFSGEANPEEQKQVENWKRENQKEFEKYREAFDLNIFSEKEFTARNNSRELILQAQLESEVASKKRYRMLFRVAALFIGLMAVGFLFSIYTKTLSYSHTNLTASTETLTLPDGSEIILAANSVIKYKKNWLGQFNRKVVFKGRGYFHITKNPEKPFSVNTERLTVTVLGTKFTINEIGDNTQVVLSEGRVRLQSKVIGSNLELNRQGDQVILNSQRVIKHNRVNSALYSAWKEEKLYFNNCTVADIINLLNDSYNVKLYLQDKKLLNKKLFGSAPSDDPQLIIKALSQILQKDIEEK